MLSAKPVRLLFTLTGKLWFVHGFSEKWAKENDLLSSLVEKENGGGDPNFFFRER